MSSGWKIATRVVNAHQGGESMNPSLHDIKKGLRAVTHDAEHAQVITQAQLKRYLGYAPTTNINSLISGVTTIDKRGLWIDDVAVRLMNRMEKRS